MKLRKTIVAVLSTTLILLMASAVIAPAVHWSGLPKIRTIYYKAYPGASPELQVGEFLDCVTDWIDGPYRGDLYEAVTNAGHNVSTMNNMSELILAAINGRDYKETSGFPNAPLNDSNWRLALSYVYGMDDKDADIFGYYGVPWVSAHGNPVPPAQQPWYDEATQMPNTNYAVAWGILTGAGYSVADYGGQQWLHRNGVPVRPPDGPNNGEIIWLYPTGAEVYPQGPGGGMVRYYNDFIINYVGAEGPLMIIAPTDYTTILVDLYAIHDFDIAAHELDDLGPYVDWLYDVCHSSNDVPWGSNFCGIHDADYDRWTEIIITSMDPNEIQEACENLTRKFVYERMDWFPLITRLGFSTTKVYGAVNFLTNIIPMELYGSRNSYSYMCQHWYGPPKDYPEDTGVWPCTGSYVVALGDEPDTLNPWTDYSESGWEIMGRSILTEPGLLGFNPSTLRNMPFVATKLRIQNWTSIPELGIEEGATAQFYLRQDVLWHDWYCNTTEYPNDRIDQAYFDPNTVDAYDCVANMRFMMEEHPGRYSSTWAHLVYSEADGPYKFNTYFDQTSLYYAYFVSKAALLVPEHVMEALEDQDIDWRTWMPCEGGINECTYDDLMGNCTDEDHPCPTPYPWMKQLVGCGPFVFRYYNRAMAVGQAEKFEEFFVNAPVIGGVAGEWRIDPGDDYSYEVVIQNVGAKTWDNWGHLTAATVDVAIFEDGAVAHIVNDTTLDPWEHLYLPGSSYVWTDPGCGPHRIKVVVTGDAFSHEYEHLFVVTIREDVSTYCGDKLDFTVDMRDVGRAARAFGTSPGNLRWDPCCDVNDDFKVDMRDIGAVARRFGWSCP